MFQLNQVKLVGQISTDVIANSTKSKGTPYVRFQIANHQGKYTNFFNGIIWNEMAIKFGRAVHKGDLTEIIGHLKMDSYYTPNGDPVQTAEFVVNGFKLIRSASHSQQARAVA